LQAGNGNLAKRHPSRRLSLSGPAALLQLEAL
jgi:hypothetical protein